MKPILKIITIFFTLLFVFSCSEDTIDQEGFGAVSGRVVKTGTNEPLENVKISTNPSSSTVFTDEDGFYRLENIPVGDYSLSAQKDGLLAAFEPITILVDIELEKVFEMEVSTANNRSPEPPTLIEPVDNAENIPIEVKLLWTSKDPDEDDTLTYTVTLRNDQDSNVERFESITDTTFTLSNLSFGRKYFWQVSASDGINSPVNSETFVFETTNVTNNRVIYTRIVNGNSVIYSANESGETEIPLTSVSKNSFRPRRNIATRKIAFLQSVGSQTHLFTMNEDGSDIKQVTSSIGVSGFNLEEIDFSWSEGGAQLLFPNQDRLYAINVDGSGQTEIYRTSGNLITEVDKNDNAGIIALKTNDLDGYSVEIITINESGVLQNTILTGENGAAGGINLSADGNQLLYTRDVSGTEDPTTYRQLDSQLFIYNISGTSLTNISTDKPLGTNDLDPRFSPNEASVIFVNTSNDGISIKNIVTVPLDDLDARVTLIENASMPDWE
ncbi:carboxypeptidase regulatory-like domain-containing protein [Aquimarina algicola]|uniref:Fibronectin type-III domain-containing protein n=1 Tax=Aquimarina algicola TaxID=2589995 RepID=A0A504JAH7_9FLAO|nr:carboxypeptidase regulatory-like domain-containing protein [Aquimarina algicola]TPN84543.1 hypothetical protein FHK87_16560 [Aquimarina algicola]